MNHSELVHKHIIGITQRTGRTQRTREHEELRGRTGRTQRTGEHREQENMKNSEIPFFRIVSGLNSFLPSTAALWNSFQITLLIIALPMLYHFYTCTTLIRFWHANEFLSRKRIRTFAFQKTRQQLIQKV